MERTLQWSLQLEPGLSSEERNLVAERSRRALHRLGAIEHAAEISEEGWLHLACSIEVTSRDTPDAEGERFVERHYDATRGPMIDFVDEFKLRPQDPNIDDLRAELTKLLEERRLWFYIYPLIGVEGIAVEIRDVGGETFEESQSIGRKLIEGIYEEAIFNLTGRREQERHRMHRGPDEFMP